MTYNQLVENFTFLDPDSRLVPADQLNPEIILYWRSLVEFLTEEAKERGVEEAEVSLEKVLPELTDFCDFVRAFFNRSSEDEATQDEDSAAVKEV